MHTGPPTNEHPTTTTHHVPHLAKAESGGWRAQAARRAGCARRGLAAPPPLPPPASPCPSRPHPPSCLSLGPRPCPQPARRRARLLRQRAPQAARRRWRLVAAALLAPWSLALQQAPGLAQEERLPRAEVPLQVRRPPQYVLRYPALLPPAPSRQEEARCCCQPGGRSQQQRRGRGPAALRRASAPLALPAAPGQGHGSGSAVRPLLRALPAFKYGQRAPHCRPRKARRLGKLAGSMCGVPQPRLTPLGLTLPAPHPSSRFPVPTPNHITSTPPSK